MILQSNVKRPVNHGFSLRKLAKNVIINIVKLVRYVNNSPFVIGFLTVIFGYPSFLLFCSFLGGFDAN